MEDSERQGYFLVAAHIRAVQTHLSRAISLLAQRMVRHDQSKYSTPELPLIQQRARLGLLPYDSPQYHEALAQIKSAVQAHYEVNDHHPEHQAQGVLDMSLLQLLEMVCDWRAAAEANGTDPMQSLDLSVERFHISAELRQILLNTYREMGWI